MRQFFIILLLAFLVGCSVYQVDVSWPEVHPLGKDLTSFYPSVHISATDKQQKLREPKGVLTLRDVLALSLMQNPSLKVSAWSVRTGEAKIQQASRLPNPELETEFEAFDDQTDFSHAETPASVGGIEAAIQLRYPIEFGGKRARRQTVAEFEAKLLGWDYEAKRLDILTETTLAFIDVLQAQEQVTLNEELTRLSEQVLNIVKAKVEAGVLAYIEQVPAQIELADTQVSLERSRYHLQVSRQVLASTWGQSTPTFGRVEGRFETILPVPAVEQLIPRISVPELDRWQTEIGLHQAVIHLEKSSRVPNVSIGSGIKYFKADGNVAFVSSLSLPLPLWDRNQGAILAAKYNLQKAYEERATVEMKIHTNLSKAQSALASAEATVLRLKSDVLPLTKSAFESTSEGHRIGKFTSLEVVNAQRTFFDFKREYINALTGYHRALAKVERLIGQPLNLQ